jgi:hypothetical protein
MVAKNRKVELSLSLRASDRPSGQARLACSFPFSFVCEAEKKHAKVCSALQTSQYTSMSSTSSDDCPEYINSSGSEPEHEPVLEAFDRIRSAIRALIASDGNGGYGTENRFADFDSFVVDARAYAAALPPAQRYPVLQYANVKMLEELERHKEALRHEEALRRIEALHQISMAHERQLFAAEHEEEEEEEEEGDEEETSDDHSSSESEGRD